MMARGIFNRTAPAFLYFKVEPTVVYRHSAETGHFEALGEGGWEPIVPSEQDYDHLRAISKEEAASILGVPVAVLSAEHD